MIMMKFKKYNNIKIIGLVVCLIFSATGFVSAIEGLCYKSCLRAPLLFQNSRSETDKTVAEAGNIKVGQRIPVVEGLEKIDIIFESLDKSRFAEGRAIFLNPEKAQIRQLFISEAVMYNYGTFSSVSKDPKVKSGEREFKRFPGKTLKGILQEHEKKDEIIFASNSLQTNFWGANGFLIIDGEYIAKPKGSLGVQQDKYVPLDGAFWVFSFDERNIGVRKIQIESGNLASSGEKIKNAVSGLPLIFDGNNISFLIEKGRPSLTGIQSDWADPQNQKAAMSAVGKDRDGNIVFIHMAGKPDEREEIVFNELAEIMMHLGVIEAIALGTSADVSQYIKGDKGPYVSGKPRRDSMSADDYPDGRPLAAFIFAYARNNRIIHENTGIFPFNRVLRKGNIRGDL